MQRGSWGSIHRADTDATYADDGPRTAEGFCGTHEGRVVPVKSKGGQLAVRIEGVRDGCGERGMERTARLCAKGDVRFKRFTAAENVSNFARRTLSRRYDEYFFWVRERKGVDAHRVALAVPDFGGGFEKESGTLSGGIDDIYITGLCCGVY